ELVRGSGLEPVAAGRDHVVLAPVPAATAPAAEGEERAETPASTPVVVLDRLLGFGQSELGPPATGAPPGPTVDAGQGARPPSRPRRRWRSGLRLRLPRPSWCWTGCSCSASPRSAPWRRWPRPARRWTP